MYTELDDQIVARENQISIPTHSSKKNNYKIAAMGVISIVNGTLYFAIAREGGGNLQSLFKVDGHASDVAIIVVGVGASLVYTMFTYKTLEYLSLKINSFPKAALSFLAPFSAAAFLTGGKNGAELLHFDKTSTIAIGMALFAFRMVNCVDASVKFPNRLLETKEAWTEAWKNKDRSEIARLIVISLVSLGYVACTTDSIYSASQIILDWLNVNQKISEPISYVSSILGAVGTLPLIVYWSHRGLRQLTFGGKSTEDGKNPDPTDCYTYLGWLLVIPVILGILGAATASTGEVFGKLGTFSQIIRVGASILYASCAGTPGMATLLRNIGNQMKDISCSYFTQKKQKII